ncbi:MAG: SLC13 family permease [Acidobacteria bacterium]|nr:MAG: SLC13 family permease [Acidobacteriota bacterium]REJ97945.1 MAG: SLC13 family permease [Acidobacteriota bacterium]REK16688.1 MAG: SLC13 family permease [Acidobacteriota bacterium]REK42599.1 MAG: SLC13 family permease [Acidobacteriota bacterium]
MTLSIAFLILVLAAMVYLFLTEKLPIDLTAFLGLVVLIFTGYVTSDQAFSGFASSAVITMLAIFIVSAALMNSGVADVAAAWIHKIVGNRELPLLVTIMLTAGILSAFMNNIAATAVLMPAVASLARRCGIQPAKIFMPLSFGAILGGGTTLVGTPPNIIAGAVLADRGLTPFELFDFTPLGLTLLALGVIYMVTFGRKLLPDRKIQEADTGRELAALYKLHEALFTIRIPEGSHMEGATLAETEIGNALGIQIVSVTRKGENISAPAADIKLEKGDELLVSGDQERIRELLHVRDIHLTDATVGELGTPEQGVSGVRLRIHEDSAILGKTLRETGFRGGLGIAVFALERDGRRVTGHIRDVKFREGDRLYGIGTVDRVAALAPRSDLFDLELTGMAAFSDLKDEPLMLIRMPENSALVGRRIGGSQFSESMRIMIVGIMRDGSVQWSISPDEVLQAGDELFVTGEKDRLKKLLKIGEVDLVSEVSSQGLVSEEVGVVEATVAPRSSLDGRTLADISFRQTKGVQVLAVWREGESLRDNLAHLPLRVGDGLLLQGKHGALARLSADDDLVVLSAVEGEERDLSKAPYSIGGLLLMIVLVVAGWQPIHVAAFAAATLVVLTGALTMKEAYRVIEWRAIFLVAAVLPVGAAMESSGTATLLANWVVEYGGALGPYAVLASLVVLSSLLSQGLDGAPAVVLLTPVVLSTASGLDISPYPLMMGVALAASAAFMTPFSHKANLLVMGAGGYRSMDYVKVGTPLTIVILIALVLLVPVFFPF